MCRCNGKSADHLLHWSIATELHGVGAVWSLLGNAEWLLI